MVDITAMGREPDVAWRHSWYSRHFLTREIFGNELPRASAKVSLLPPVSFSLRRTITFRPVDSTDAAEMIAVLQDAIDQGITWAKKQKYSREMGTGVLACSRFRRHRVRCFDGAGGVSWRERKFTREFKLEAVRIKERGVPYAQASQDLGVHPSQLRDWVKKFAEDANQAFPGNGQIAWLTRPRSQRSRSDEELGAKVRASFVASDRTYGTRRVWKDMLAEGGYRAVCIGLSG